MRWILNKTLLIWVILLTLLPWQVQAQLEEADMLKAAFVYNFAKYVQWPKQSQTDAPFQLCLLGSGRIIDALQRLQGETLQNRPVTVRRTHPTDTFNQCQLLFIGESEHPRLETLLRTINSQPVLTVSDIPDFAMRGGIIGFFWEQSKVRFAINLQSAKKSQLTISSRLLKLAKTIEDTP